MMMMDEVTITTSTASSFNFATFNQRTPAAVVEVLNNPQLLGEILSNLWSVPALARGRLVCHQWQQVIERTVLPSYRHLYLTFDKAPVRLEEPKSLAELDKPDRFHRNQTRYQELEARFNMHLEGGQRPPPMLRVVYDRQARWAEESYHLDYAEFSLEQVALLAAWFPRVELVCLNLGMNSRYTRAPLKYRTETAANFATLLGRHWPRLQTLSVWPSASAGPLFNGEAGRLLAGKLCRLDLQHARMDHIVEGPRDDFEHFRRLWDHRLEHFSFRGLRDEVLFSRPHAAMLHPLGAHCTSLAFHCSDPLAKASGGLNVDRLANWVDRCAEERLGQVRALSLGLINNHVLEDSDEDEDEDEEENDNFARRKPYQRNHPNVGVEVFHLLGDHFHGLLYLSLEFDYDYFYAKLSPSHFASLSRGVEGLLWLGLKRVSLDLDAFDKITCQGQGQDKGKRAIQLSQLFSLHLSDFSLTGVMLDPNEDSDYTDEDSSSSSSDFGFGQNLDSTSSDGGSSSDEGEDKVAKDSKQPKDDGEQGDDEVFDPRAYGGDDGLLANKKKRPFPSDQFCRVLSTLAPNLTNLGLGYMQSGVEHIVGPIRASSGRYFPNGLEVSYSNL